MKTLRDRDESSYLKKSEVYSFTLPICRKFILADNFLPYTEVSDKQSSLLTKI